MRLKGMDMGHIDYFRFNRMSFNEGWAQFFPDRLQHLRIRLVCNLYPDRISICYHFFLFWKDPGRQRNLQHVPAMGRLLVFSARYPA
jgi:hypothetical protein